MGAKQRGTKLWTGGIVPYEIDPTLGNEAAIRAAIITFEQQTNLRFVQRYRQDDYIRFSKQTRGFANSDSLGRKGGRQYVNASVSVTKTLLHEMGHAVGLAHEHQRHDRDDFVIFHEDRAGGEAVQYEKEDMEARTATYDFESLMHYDAGNPINPIFESKTGIPTPDKIGINQTFTVTDLLFLETLFPAAPVIRRTDGEGGAGEVHQTSTVAVPDVNNSSVAFVANAVQNGSGNYHFVMWKLSDIGEVRRMPEPAGAEGGSAFDVQMVSIGSWFVSAMADADGELLLITHDATGARAKDSGNQAGEIRGHHVVALPGWRVLTACITGSDGLLLITWQVGTDGSVVRLADTGTNGPPAASPASVVIQANPTSQIVAVLYRGASSNLVVSTWRVSDTSIDFIADSGDQIGKGDLASLSMTPTGHLVVACRDASGDLLLIPFTFNVDGADLQRIVGAEGHAGGVRDVAVIQRPYGLLTAVIADDGHVLLIKWGMDGGGTLNRLGESGTQAGEGSVISAAALHFAAKATVVTAVRAGNGDLLPIIWDDVDGPGDLTVA